MKGVSRDGFPTGRLCDCHGLPMDYTKADGYWRCAEHRRENQRKYMQRKRDDFRFRAEDALKARRRNALWYRKVGRKLRQED